MKRKLLSLLLSILMLVTTVTPGVVPFVNAAASDAYAVVFTASDFQSSSCYSNLTAMMQAAKADGITDAPDGFIFGGDYTPDADDPAVQVPKITDTILAVYPGYDEDKIIYVQGNHDDASSVLTPTGLHVFDDYIVYSINEDNYKSGQSGRTGYEETVKALAADVAASLLELRQNGDRRPVFVATHVPLHHSSRSSYGDALYSKHLFDVLNEYGQFLDIIFLFGHNHSDNYDDYIGGAVNYIAKGDTIRIPVPDTNQMGANGYTDEKLNFTYMNYGYVGYSGNADNSTSTSTLTMGAFQLCPTTIEISRYTTKGVYTTETISRINPQTEDPYVNIQGDVTGTKGDSAVVYSTTANVGGAVYTWSTTDSSVVKVLGAGKNAQLLFINEGTAQLTLTVTGTDGKSASDTVTVTVNPCTTTETVETTVVTRIYKLVTAITAGKEYVIASANKAGTTTAISNVEGADVLNAASVTLSAADKNICNAVHIKNPDSSIVWVVSGERDNYLIRNDGNYITGPSDTKNYSLTLGTSEGNTAKWKYQNSKLSIATIKNCTVAFSNNSYTTSKNGTNVYLYERTDDYVVPGEPETIIVAKPYAPEVSLKKGAADVDGRTLKLYDVSYGDGFMLDGSFEGFVDRISDVTVTWTSSDPSVATVENGYVTYVSSGETTISYVVTDGTTTVAKSVKLILSRGARPVDSFVLTDTFEAGKSYIIADINTAGAGNVMSFPVIETGSSTTNVRLSATVVNIEQMNGVPTIHGTNDALVWNAVAASDGGIYLVNELYGTYLYIQQHGDSQDLDVTDDKTLSGTVWIQNANGFIVTRSGNMGIQFSSDKNFRACNAADISKQFLYEKTETTPFVTLKCDNVNANGVTNVIYSVNSSMTRTLKGSYTNFGENVSVQWISSDPAIATVNEYGVVAFTGEEGIVDITYLVTDTDGNEASATTTFATKLVNENLRVFKYTETIEAGKKYVILSEKDAGSAQAMLSDHYSSSKLAGQTVVIQPDTSDGSVYVEIPVDDLSPVWTAESAGTNGYFRFVSDNDGTYLWAGADGAKVSTDASLTTYDAKLYSWTYDGESLYNQQYNTAYSLYTGIRVSSSGYFKVIDLADADESEIYIFEETVLEPYVHIRSKYVNVENTVISRGNVSPFQTEQLMGKPEHFPNNAYATFEWTSSDPTVAAIDKYTGIVTYTGKPGDAVITLVATSILPDTDGNYATASSSVTLRVLEQTLATSYDFVITDNFVHGEFYVLAPSAAAGESVMLKDEIEKGSSEYRMKSTACTIEESSKGMIIKNTDNMTVWECIESDVEGYFYLRNAETGGYLALSASNSLSLYRQVATTAALDDGYAHEAYLICRNGEQVYSKQSYEYKTTAGERNENVLIENGSGRFRLSWSSGKMYIYQRASGDAISPTVQIRVSTFLGTDNITNTLQSRYNIKNGDTEQLLRYVDNFAAVTDVQWSVSDESVAAIDKNGLLTYTGKEGFVTVTLTVTGTDAAGETVTQTVRTTIYTSSDDYESPTENYPEFPHEGSVRINKTASNIAGGYNFQSSGVTEVELSVTGVPLPQPVDVVIVFDHSSSMNSGGRLTSAIEDTRDFALQLVNANRSNRIAVVTFDRYRDNYKSIDSAADSYSSSGTEDKIITGDGTAAGAFMSIDQSEALIAQIDSLAYNNIAGTNYDYGLQQAYEILKAAKSDPKANKMQYVIFMSDGEPYVYNDLHVEYTKETDPDGVYEAWLRGDESHAVLGGYLADPDTYPAVEHFNSRGDNWFSEIIKTPEGETLSDMPALSDYDAYREGLGATMFTIGYGAGQPGSLTRDILATMATTEDYFYYAESDLQVAYDSILEKIVYAANNAVVTDKMGENFSLQLAPTVKLANGMGSFTFSPSPAIEIGAWTLNSDATRNEYTVYERITFVTGTDGNLTAAYSSVLGDVNIYDAESNVIAGSAVTYDLSYETFTWNIGDITRDEITLKYYAYLEGSAEGEREAGAYDTNEYAVLNYINYRGYECQQIFPVPTMPWKDFVVSYEFYLVNENGEPVNSEGIVVPFAERVLIGQEKSETHKLNSAQNYTAVHLVANEKLPDGYVLFNENAAYDISVSSGDSPSEAVIIDNMAIVTTYFRDGTTVYCGNGIVPDVTDYTNTHVSFAVLYMRSVVPDTVVIDYGLPVRISVLKNDVGTGGGKLNAIGTGVEDGTLLYRQPYDTGRLTGTCEVLTLENGTAVIDGDVIIFTPSNLTMDSENQFFYEYVTADGKYLYSTVTVIPATNIYYEESFFTFKDGNGYTWKTAGDTDGDKFQAEDRPGVFAFADSDANNVYGYDGAYEDSFTYSLGSVKYTSVDAKALGKEPTAEFTFCGTGFDLFSVTSNDTGAVLVSVYKTNGALYKNFIVQTYYGYDYSDGAFVPTPENKDVLYQVPVISARDLGYDTYRVVIKPMYSPIFDMDYDADAEYNSYDIYVDSVRIYDPVSPENLGADSVITDAYLEDGEYSPEYMELRRTLLSADTFYSQVLAENGYGTGSIFIDGKAALPEDALSDIFLSAGPNNEVYLAQGQAVAFHVTTKSVSALSSVQLGMKTAYGGTAQVALMNTRDLTPRYGTVSGAHEMYRRLNSVIVWNPEPDSEGRYQTKYPIVIVNTSDAVLSLTQLKWAFSEMGVEGDVQLVVEEETPVMAYAVARRVMRMQSFPYTADDITINWVADEIYAGDEALLSVTTPADIDSVTVDGIDAVFSHEDENGNLVWTCSFIADAQGEYSCEVILTDCYMNVSEPLTTPTLSVIEKPAVDTDNTEDTDETEENNPIKSMFDLFMRILLRFVKFFKEVMA